MATKMTTGKETRTRTKMEMEMEVIMIARLAVEMVARGQLAAWQARRERVMRAAGMRGGWG